MKSPLLVIGTGAVLLVLASFSGCSDSSDSTSGDSTSSAADTASTGDSQQPPVPASAACARDPELMAQRQACLQDDHCPCGTHCDLGLCASTCTADADCGSDERCDDFGRCGSASQTGKIAPFAPAQAAQLVTIPSQIRLAGGQPTYRVRLLAAYGAGGRARVEARGAVEVRCASSEEFAGECFLASVPEGGVEIEARAITDGSKADGPKADGPKADGPKADDPAGPEDATTILVFDEAGHIATIPVSADAAATESPTGQYDGYLWLRAPADAYGPGEDGEAALGALDLARGPARVRVFGADGAYTVAVDDINGVVLEGTLVLAATRVDTGSLSATLPAMVLFRGEGPAGEEAAEVSLARTPSTAGQLSDGLAELHFDAPLMGLDLGGKGLPWRLVISATRSADLPVGESAPPITEDAALEEALNRGQTASAAFSLAATLADAGDPAKVPGDLVPFAAVADLANAVACFASPSEHDAAAAGRNSLLVSACNDAYATAGIGLTAASTNGQAKSATCTGAEPSQAVSIVCEWTRVDSVQVGTGCQQCTDACVAEQVANCSGNWTDGYCAQFDPNVNCLACEEAFFFPSFCGTSANDKDCNTECKNFCAQLNTTLGKTEVTTQCLNQCKLAPTSCTPSPVFEQQTVKVGNCNELAATWQCAVNDTSGTLAATLNGKNVTYTAKRACTFDPLIPTSEAQCVEAAACVDAAAFAANVGYASSVSPDSGDPQCNNATDAAFPILEGGSDDLTTLLDACATDIEAEPLAAASLTGLFGSAGCFDRGRFFLATDRAFLGTRAGAGDATAEAMGHRLVQNFVQAHALVATMGLNRYREELVLGTTGNPTAGAAEALEQSMSLWATVLHPRLAGALLALQPEVLRAPDPRPRLGLAVTDQVATARVGIAVNLLEALSGQMALVDALLERAWFEGDAARLAARQAIASTLLRLTGPVDALVAGLLAGAAGGETTWATAWARTAPGYRHRVESLMRRLEVIASGASPIGVEDADLPLYYRGDPLQPNERFAAVSLGLLGEGAGAFAVVPRAVEAAQTALDAVGAAWHERTDAKTVSEQRIQDIKYRYGELITGFCGASIENDTNYAGPGAAPCLNPGSQSVFDCPEIDTGNCFVEEACRGRAGAFIETMSSADLGAQLCVFSGLRRIYGANFVGASPAIDAVLQAVGVELAEAQAAGTAFPLQITSLEQRGPNERVAVIDLDGTTIEVPLDAVGALDVKTPGAALATPEGKSASYTPQYFKLVDGCEASRQATLSARPTAVPASCDYADNCPSGYACRESHCEALSATDPLDSVDCYYDGAMSEQAIAVRAAADDIEIARREFDEVVESYDLAKRSCILLKAANEDIEDQTADHNDKMRNLNLARTIAASAAAAASGTKDCAASFNVDKVITGAVAGVCIAAGVEAAANITIEALENRMAQAERDHEEALLAIQNNVDEAICFNDAEMELVAARAAVMRIARAQQDQAIAAINLRGLKSYTLGLFVEGNEAVAQERARLERSITAQFVVSEKAETFARRMAYARRVTYLAERAVEYEFQASLKDRQTILAATRPEQLDAALQSLGTWVNAGKVNGASPDALHAVVSLRQHLLQIGDKTTDPEGQQGLNDVERFRLMLTSRRYAEYDEQGVYQGQRIPFTLAPLGTLGLGKSQGVPIVADNDCAERLWSVNAAVLGAGVYEGNESSFTRLDLLKKNTFFSQWCQAPKSDGPFQVASVRPAVNLFQDPTDPNRRRPQAQDVLDYTRGRVQPYLNVTRAEFEKEDYAQGATTELAGRGLYGDYAIFIPKSVLSIDNSPGLRLDRIEDILLRLDYVSVAR